MSALVILPIVVYIVLGTYALWVTDIFTWVWWILPICWLLTYILARVWKTERPSEQPQHSLSEPPYWTPRDREAADIVRGFQQKVETLTPDQLTDPHFYVSEAQALGTALARHYHPNSSDPFMSLTVPELLAAIRLAGDDMERWMLTSVPGSRLLTIQQWQMLQSAPMWIRRIQNTAWAASMLFNPANIARYYFSKLTQDPITTELQTELLAAVYLRYIRQVGFYLIEMNSGRLRGGADVYRKTLRAARHQAEGDHGAESSDAIHHSPVQAPQAVTISLVGQVSSGKSSLINALTGTQQASVDILPETRSVQRYQYSAAEGGDVVTLLDTPGYGDTGATREQLEQIRKALRESDAVLVVMDAHSPAREADRRTIAELDTWYKSQPRLKPPPMLGVLTHVDLLKPTLEWAPPYNWREPTRPKEHSIRNSVDYVTEVLGESLTALIPVCSDAGRLWGIVEDLVPALMAILDDAQSVALLRAFELELDRGRMRILLQQLKRSGRDLVRCWLEERLGLASETSDAPLH